MTLNTFRAGLAHLLLSVVNQRGEGPRLTTRMFLVIALLNRIHVEDRRLVRNLLAGTFRNRLHIAGNFELEGGPEPVNGLCKH